MPKGTDVATAELPPARSTELPLEPEMHPLVLNKHDLVSVGNAIGNVVLDGNHPRGWWIGCHNISRRRCICQDAGFRDRLQVVL